MDHLTATTTTAGLLLNILGVWLLALHVWKVGAITLGNKEGSPVYRRRFTGHGSVGIVLVSAGFILQAVGPIRWLVAGVWLGQQ